MICKAENISPSYANTITESSTCIDNSNKILNQDKPPGIQHYPNKTNSIRINHLISNQIQNNLVFETNIEPIVLKQQINT